MIGRSFWQHVRNVFENSLPDTDLDREYFDMLEEQSGNDTKTVHAPTETLSDAYYSGLRQETGAEPQQEASTNQGYIHTVRGVRVSFADINRPRCHTSRNETDPSSASAARNNELNLTQYKSPPQELSPHVLDLHS